MKRSTEFAALLLALVIFAALAAWPVISQLQPLRPSAADLAAREQQLRLNLSNAGNLTANLQQQLGVATDANDVQRIEGAIRHWQRVEERYRSEIESIPRHRR